jgi:hypothetical protein
VSQKKRKKKVSEGPFSSMLSFGRNIYTKSTHFVVTAILLEYNLGRSLFFTKEK